jgi:hypothetical protein
LGSVCCDGEAAITLWYESIACKTITVNGFVIVCVYIYFGVFYLYHLWYMVFHLCFLVLADAFFKQFRDFCL